MKWRIYNSNASELHDITYTSNRIGGFCLAYNLPTERLPDGSHIRKSPKADLGALDVLPLELLHNSLSQLDIQTFTDFQRVNRRAIEVTESIP